MGKKAGVKMSLNEATVKFGGDPRAGQLPTHSEGKDWGKPGKGKGGGLRDFEECRAEQNEWRSSGGGKGDRDGGKGGQGGFRRDRDQGDSRADAGDWRGGARDSGPRDDRGDDRGARFGGGGGFRRDGEGGERRGGGDRRGVEDTQANQDSDWRGGMGRQREEERDDRGGERRGFGGSSFRDRDRGGPDERRHDGPRERDGPRDEERRPKLNLKPRSKPLPGEAERDPVARGDDDDTSKAQRPRTDPFGGARPIATQDESEGLSRTGSKANGEVRASPPWKKTKAPADQTGTGAADTEDGEAEGGDGDTGEWETVGPKKGGTAAGGQGARKEERAKPARSSRRDGSDESGNDDDARKGADGNQKWIPPSVRRMEEERRQKQEQVDQRRKEEEVPRRRDEEVPRRRVEDDSKRRAEADDKMRSRDNDRKPLASGSKSSSAYVPPAQRKAQEEQRRREDEREAKAREEEETRRQQEEERAEAERERKRKVKEQKELEAKARKEKEQSLKASAAPSKGALAAPGKAPAKQDWNENNLKAFDEKCDSLLDDDSTDIEDAVEETTAVLSESEFQTILPISHLLERLLQHCRGKTDEEVVGIVQRFAPLVSCMIDKAGVHRFKMKVLIEAQRLAYEMGLPRLTPASSLLEVFFDGLYCSEIIEEDYFQMWAINGDDTPGKNEAMFQVDAFLTWLRTAPVDGEESEPDDDGEEREAGSDESEEEDSDIEKLIPQRVASRIR